MKRSACQSNDGGCNSSSSSSVPSLPCRNLYVCVYCGAPCAALYRQLNKNSLSSIKAMRCEQCHRIVDPYIEREWLLVGIDCILLRPEAYRHILYNDPFLSWYVHVQENETNFQQREKGNRDLSRSTTSTSRIQRLVQWTLVSSLLHAFLKLQTLIHMKQQQEHRIEDDTTMNFAIFPNDLSMLLQTTFFVTSILDLVAQWLAIYGYMKLMPIESDSSSKAMVTNTKQNDNDNNNGNNKSARPSTPTPSHNLAYQIYLGLLLPTSFQVVCALVLLWENSKTTRALGSLLIACWQYLGISLLSINNRSRASTQSIFKACTPLVGVVSLIAWRFGIGRLLLFLAKRTGNSSFKYLIHTPPCVGFELDVFNDVGNIITEKDWSSSPLLLCLT